MVMWRAQYYTGLIAERLAYHYGPHTLSAHTPVRASFSYGGRAHYCMGLIV